MPLPPTPPLRESAWLAHLELLAGLDYAAPVLMPAVLATLRSGFDADFGNFGWVEGAHLRPVAFWSERMTEPALRWFIEHQDELFAEFPLRQQLDSDGDAVRMFQAMPGYEDHWHHRQILEPLGVRWAMGVPVQDSAGQCGGFVYLYRRAAVGPFTDAEQARLRRARDRLRRLRSPPGAPAMPDGPVRPAQAAVLHFDTVGRMAARSAQAVELLYLCHEGSLGLLDWAARDWSVLPPEARAMAQALLVGNAAPAMPRCRVQRAAGALEFRAALLQPLNQQEPTVAVTITYLEPQDLAVARELLHWPLSPQEKKLLVVSVRDPSHRELADALGVAPSTLKTYVNGLLAKLGVASRQEVLQQVLQCADQRADADARSIHQNRSG